VKVYFKQELFCVRKFLALLIPDLLALVGVASLVYGVYLIFPPAAYIVFGCILIAIFNPTPTTTNGKKNK